MHRRGNTTPVRRAKSRWQGAACIDRPLGHKSIEQLRKEFAVVDARLKGLRDRTAAQIPHLIDGIRKRQVNAVRIGEGDQILSGFTGNLVCGPAAAVQHQD